jgi:CRP/FNR family transcriptional regulator, cyclic AMP receptor protein
MRKALIFLGILNDSDLDWMMSTGKKIECPPKTVLITEGKRIDSLFLVIDGRLSVTVAALQGREVAQLQSGEIIGEMSFVDSRPPSASVTALDQSSLLAVPRNRLSAKLNSDMAFGTRFYRALSVFLADRLRSTVATLGYNSGKPMEQEVEYEDELDGDMLDQVSIAGARFEFVQRKLRSI